MKRAVGGCAEKGSDLGLRCQAGRWDCLLAWHSCWSAFGWLALEASLICVVLLEAWELATNGAVMGAVH